MGREKRKENIDAFYEVEIQKNELIPYFCDDDDFDFFINLFKKESLKRDFKIISYVFLKDSIRFIVLTENFEQISLLMANILRQYSRYYKKKYNYENSVFEKRYKLTGIKKDELSKKVLTMHNKILNSGYDEKESRYSSFSDYFVLDKEERICNTDYVYTQISKDEFYIKHYSFKSENDYDEIKEYICEELKTNDYRDIKNVPKRIRNDIVKSLHYNENKRVSDISGITELSRQTIYNIIKRN